MDSASRCICDVLHHLFHGVNVALHTGDTMTTQSDLGSMNRIDSSELTNGFGERGEASMGDANDGESAGMLSGSTGPQVVGMMVLAVLAVLSLLQNRRAVQAGGGQKHGFFPDNPDNRRGGGGDPIA
eukprot:GHVQ01028118.1.p1 GENE.GHVQ01028118.1~~GHVQ01028118.1.p1  ORF type:complete len:127 (-),score=12.42 GHVQ01028118.1:602-982(-)